MTTYNVYNEIKAIPKHLWSVGAASASKEAFDYINQNKHKLCLSHMQVGDTLEFSSGKSITRTSPTSFACVGIALYNGHIAQPEYDLYSQNRKANDLWDSMKETHIPQKEAEKKDARKTQVLINIATNTQTLLNDLEVFNEKIKNSELSQRDIGHIYNSVMKFCSANKKEKKKLPKT